MLFRSVVFFTRPIGEGPLYLRVLSPIRRPGKEGKLAMDVDVREGGGEDGVRRRHNRPGPVCTALWIPASEYSAVTSIALLLLRAGLALGWVRLWWSECSSAGASGCDAQQVTTSRGIPWKASPCVAILFGWSQTLSFQRG